MTLFDTGPITIESVEPPFVAADRNPRPIALKVDDVWIYLTAEQASTLVDGLQEKLGRKPTEPFLISDWSVEMIDPLRGLELLPHEADRDVTLTLRQRVRGGDARILEWQREHTPLVLAPVKL